MSQARHNNANSKWLLFKIYMQDIKRAPGLPLQDYIFPKFRDNFLLICVLDTEGIQEPINSSVTRSILLMMQMTTV